MAQINVKWDTKEVEKNIFKLKVRMREKAKEAAYVGASVIGNESEKQCPYDTGYLKDSYDMVPMKFSMLGDNYGYTIGYGIRHRVPYARRLHEHPEYKFQRGKKGKFLEDPLKMNAGNWQGKMQDKFKEAFI